MVRNNHLSLFASPVHFVIFLHAHLSLNHYIGHYQQMNFVFFPSWTYVSLLYVSFMRVYTKYFFYLQMVTKLRRAIWKVNSDYFEDNKCLVVFDNTNISKPSVSLYKYFFKLFFFSFSCFKWFHLYEQLWIWPQVFKKNNNKLTLYRVNALLLGQNRIQILYIIIN